RAPVPWCLCVLVFKNSCSLRERGLCGQLRGGFGEEGAEIRGEGTGDLEAERFRRVPPEDDLGLGEERPRAHADREGGQIEVERAAGVEQGLGMRPRDLECDL